VGGRGHGLLSHLALVHVPRRLVKVGQGDGAGQVAQKASLPDLLVSRARMSLLPGDADLHVDLEGEVISYNMAYNYVTMVDNPRQCCPSSTRHTTTTSAPDGLRHHDRGH
jgi:hypothetical protein